MADLTVTQLLQESVREAERGVVGGVQHSLNMFMDMLKFTLVIIIPHIRHFGYLIIASYAFICVAGCLFSYHSWSVRGYLFHCCKPPVTAEDDVKVDGSGQAPVEVELKDVGQSNNTNVV